MKPFVRLEAAGIVGAVLLLVGLPSAVHGWRTPGAVAFTGIAMAGGCALAWWRTRPRLAAGASCGLLLVAVLTAAPLRGWFPDSGDLLVAGALLALALAWGGRAAWPAGLAGVVLAASVAAVTHAGVVAALMLTVPSFAAGTALRLRREAAVRLAARARELEVERELYAEIALRHERARIAGELHDIVGHAISVMVIQAAAGRRLVERDPERARGAFAAIAESAREGGRDLVRLVDLLGRGESAHEGAPDLELIEEVVSRASSSGLQVTCRLRGDRDRLAPEVAQLGFRVVQESLTNALRHAPGATVRILVEVDPAGDRLRLRIENDAAAAAGMSIVGSGRGLSGLRERVVAHGGRFSAGSTVDGGWAVEASMPTRHVPAPPGSPRVRSAFT